MILDAKYRTTYNGEFEFIDTGNGNAFYPSNMDEFDFEQDSVYKLCVDESLDIKWVF